MLMWRVGNDLLRAAVGSACGIAHGLITTGRRERCSHGKRRLNDRLEDLSPMDRHLLGSFDAEPHLVTTNLHHNNRDVIVDDNALVFFSRKNKHFPKLSVSLQCTDLPPLVKSSEPTFWTAGFVGRQGGL